MKLLSEALPPGELADFYAGLLASEARHHQVYIDLALRYASKEEVFERLAELAKCEAQALSECVEHVRMHSA
jgi:tRNA-(ms[2]io[6]A)-hydroxylase